jgi:hypothetical protein
MDGTTGRRTKRPSLDCGVRSRLGGLKVHALGRGRVCSVAFVTAGALLALHVPSAAPAPAAVSRNGSPHALLTAASARPPTRLARATERSLGGRARRMSLTSQSDCWSQAQAVPDPATGVDSFSSSVALSSDGSVALIGAPDTTVGGQVAAGAAYFFTRSGAGWSQAQAVPDPAGRNEESAIRWPCPRTAASP